MRGRFSAARESLNLSMEGVLERERLSAQGESCGSVWPQRKRIRIAHFPSPPHASFCSVVRVDGRTGTFILLYGGSLLPFDSVSELSQKVPPCFFF